MSSTSREQDRARSATRNARPFLSYGAYTKQYGCQLFTISLLDNDQSTWHAERVSFDLLINFASAVLAGDLAMVVSVLGAEEVKISRSGECR
jgi:hypothetical protein